MLDTPSLTYLSLQAQEDDRDFEAGEFYDVVASQWVRFDLNLRPKWPYSGATIMHFIFRAAETWAYGLVELVGGKDLNIPY